ncbi:cbb3-type cytochrome oxidase assembly protein CcoS [Helicobacter fennelliae]|uniref:Thioredoxin reductase n=1 Tax=Helicobacter fennelliae MRY12-0050 TaxID=1325130 RepID=T1D3F0_9HELI|nr:cbb3-type cytochrome oxidase assembly protein CcoS [Helicobacter fennelliae]GAD19731.1 thioredoxin reductase [Helicobacter fennelliae MRY12-0050]STP07230.1 thioredoxin reductase TrxB [Helicobacter fennelliae]STQ85186.1 thioredoxin reductase TrxB [Helicobacter fennelliae]
MNTPILTIMLIVSIIIGLIGLVVFLWGLKSGQFDDAVKMTHGALFDNEEDLNFAYKMSLKGEEMKHIYDVAIIGAGPGGIGACVEAKVGGIDNIILFEKTAQHNATLRKFYKDGKRVDRDYKGTRVELEGTIEFQDSNKELTLELFENLLTEHKIDVAYESDVESIKKEANGEFLIQTGGNRTYYARFVIVTIGKMGQPNKPIYKIPSTLLRKVNYNLSSLQEGEKILVVGGGNSAVEYACELANTHDTTLNYRRESFSRINETNDIELKKQLESGKLKAKLGIDITELSDENGRIKVHFTDGTSEVFDRAIYAIGGSSPVDFLKKCNIQTDENSIPIVNENFETSIQGIFVAGDILFKSGASIATAIAQTHKIIQYIKSIK